MSLIQEIRSYRPWNEQEERDQKQMLRYMEHNANYLERSDEVAHFSASIWTLNPGTHQNPDGVSQHL